MILNFNQINCDGNAQTRNFPKRYVNCSSKARFKDNLIMSGNGNSQRTLFYSFEMSY